MDQSKDKTSRQPRADSLRNRARLLAAARDVFSAGGPEASLEAVARRAEVGIGTLYRHFPTREALFQAVYKNEVDQLVAHAEDLSEDASPADALRRWLHANVVMVATKKGMLAALTPATDSALPLYADSSARLMHSIEMLMQRAISSGEIRADIRPDEVMRALIGICYTRDQPDCQETVSRLIDVFVDGLCEARNLPDSD